MINTLFYKYVAIENPAKLKYKYYAISKKHNLMGTILISKEGINGNLTGEPDQVKAFEQELHADDHFSDVEFKHGLTKEHNFKRLSVKIRKEIVTCRFDADLKNRGEYIEPKELKKLLDSDEEVVMVDVRNRYEYKIGRFKDAVELPMDVHRQFPKAVQSIENLKDKQIVTYCTGGVRCEKATAYLREQGFSNVRQLHGGIVKYGLDVGNTHWEGKCMVFDTRGAIDIDPKNQSEPISQCNLCHMPSADYHNCSVVTCDKRFIACDNCLKTLHGCCCKDCRSKKEQIAQ